MPVIKSALKQLRQSRAHHTRNYATRVQVKEVVKKTLQFAKAGNSEEAAKSLQSAYKIIDIAAKKHIFHTNRAARKKSNLARAVSAIGKK